MHTRPRRCKNAANSPFQRGIFRNPIAFSCQHKHSASPQEIVAKACARRKAFNARNAQHARCIRYQVRKHHTTNGWSSMEQETQWGPMAALGKRWPQAKPMRLQKKNSAAFLGSHLRRKDEARTRASRGESRRTLKVIGVEQTRSR